MTKMIDTEQAWKTAQKVFSDPVLLHAIRVVLDKTSTVDAVEVVRCEDCEHCVKNPAGYVCYDPRDIYAEGVKVYANDFCSYGERRGKDAVD